MRLTAAPQSERRHWRRLLGASLAAALACGPAVRETPPPSAPAVDLVAALPATDSAPLTTAIDASDPGMQAHLLKGWSRTRGAGMVLALPAARASAWFEVGAHPVDLTLIFTWRIEDAARRVPPALIRVNARPVGRMPLRAGEHEQQVFLPAARQLPGRNVLEISVPGARLRGRAIRPQPRIGLRSIVFRRSGPLPPIPSVQGDRLIFPQGASVTYFLRVPRDGRLVLGTRGSVKDLRVSIEAEGRGEREVTADADVDLTAEAGLLTRLTLVADRPVTLLRPHLEGQAPEPVRRASTARGSNVVLYVADTLRADRLGCYGYDRPTSPHLDAFAAEGVVFEQVYAQSSWTRPATASLLTGRYAFEHGATSLMDALRTDVATLPEILRRAGYATAAFVTNLNVTARFGFGRGFDEFHYLEERRDRDGVYASAADLNAAAFPWLEAHRDGPFFLYLHASDPHAPYRPPPDYAARFARSDIHPTITPDGTVGPLLGRAAELAPDDVTLLASLYDAEVAILDAGFGALRTKLTALDLDRRTLIIFVADHGEEFGEHGGLEHGHTLYQEVVHVPLIVRWPGAADGGRVETGLARQIDLVPTVLAALGIDLPPGLLGRVLPARDMPGADPDTLLETELAGGGRVGLVVDGLKTVWGSGGRGPGTLELYDLRGDPGEQRNLAATRPIVAGYARQAAARLKLTSWTARRPPPAEDTRVVDPETERRLRALGYLGESE